MPVSPLISKEQVATLRAARHVIVLTGAGISAESGIPTFRDGLSGLWSRFDPQELATPAAFRKDPELVWGWYEWRRMQAMRAAPNPGHEAIAALTPRVPRLTLITQNVDDLHERAGSENALHLHGSLFRPRCFECGRAHTFAPGIPDEPEGGRRLAPPRCGECGGLVRPGVVWFGEELPPTQYAAALKATGEEGCDLFLAVGTSGMVYPTAGLPVLAARTGARVVEVNPQPNGLNGAVRDHLSGPAGVLLPALLAAAWSGA